MLVGIGCAWRFWKSKIGYPCVCGVEEPEEEEECLRLRRMPIGFVLGDAASSMFVCL